MKNINVSLKMALSYLTMMVLCVCICVVGMVGIGNLRSEMISFYDDVVVAIEYIGRVRENFQEQRVLVQQLAMTDESNADSMEATIAAIEQNKLEMRGYLSGYEADILGNLSAGNQEILSEENIQVFADFNDLYNDFFLKEIDLILNTSANLRAKHTMLFISSDKAEQMRDILSDNIDFYTQVAQDSIQEANVLRDRSALIILIATFLSLVVCGFYSLYLPVTIARPLRRMVRAADAVAAGDMTFQLRHDPSRRDEVGKLSNALERMRDAISDQVGIVEALADGDLSVEPKLRGDKDTLGEALTRLTAYLGRIIAEVTAASESVAKESNHVAMESQELAQGTTEQAASVEELSSAFYEISLNTKENATLAGKAATVSDDVRQMAVEGEALMARMIQAVQDADTASKSIDKIIKTIEEISFQTNLLALNAAVEAAHAGQNGSGFAVVASEVRSLASKSAASSKETGELIANALEKVQLGAEIANQTSASFKRIMNGVVESSRLVGDIAKSSEEQALAIEQINTGISQVAQVIHLNSGAAEKTAASAEKMNKQAKTLEQTVSLFKQKGLPSPAALAPLSETLPEAPAKAPQIDLTPAIPSDDFGKY